MHPVLQQRIVNLPHPHPGALLYTFDGGFSGQAAVDRFVDAPDPAFVIGEHLVGLQDLLMLALRAELRRAGHAVDLLAHLGEGRDDPLPLGFRILSDGMFDMDARLVKNGVPPRHAHDQLQTGQCDGASVLYPRIRGAIIRQLGIGYQFRQHHRHCLKRLDLHFLIAARFDMLNAQHADCPLPPHDRYAGKAVEQFLAGFRPIAVVRVRRCLIQVQRLHIGRDQADKPLAHCHAGDVHGFLLESARREQFQHAFADQIDGTDLAGEYPSDDVDHLVQLGLRAGAGGHHLLQADEYLTGGGGGRARHEQSLTDRTASFQGEVRVNPNQSPSNLRKTPALAFPARMGTTKDVRQTGANACHASSRGGRSLA